MLETTPTAPKFLDQSNATFTNLHRACDTVYRDLHSQGIGAAVKHTSTFSLEEEEKLWSTGILSILEQYSTMWVNIFALGVERNSES